MILPTVKLCEQSMHVSLAFEIIHLYFERVVLT